MKLGIRSRESTVTQEARIALASRSWKCSWPRATLTLSSPSYPSNLVDERESINHLLIPVFFSRFCSLENNDKYPEFKEFNVLSDSSLYVYLFSSKLILMTMKHRLLCSLLISLINSPSIGISYTLCFYTRALFALKREF